MKKLLLLILFPLYAWGQTSDANLKAVQIDPKIRNVSTSAGITKGNVSDVLQAIVNSKMSRIEANSTGGTNTYTASISWVTGYSFGLNFPIVFNTGNTAAATLNINTLGAISIKKSVTTALSSGDIITGQVFWVFYDGTNFQLSGGTGGGGGSGTVTSVTSADANATVATTTTTPVITIVSAPKWATPRTIAITGDISYTSPSLDGTGNVTGAGTLATVNGNVGTFGSATQVGGFTVNGKGLITAAGNTTVTPAIGSITGLGTGIATALAINIGNAGAPILFNGAAGTFASGVATNLTGLPPTTGINGWPVNASGVLTNNGSGTLTWGAGGGGGYTTIANAGSNLTQRTLLNFSTGLTAVDNSGSTRTDVTNNLSTGVSGGQSVIGGTASGNNLTHQSTTHATKGSHIFDAYKTNNFTNATQVSAKTDQLPTFNSGTQYQGGGWLVSNTLGSGYTNGSYGTYASPLTFTYTSGTVATNLQLAGIFISGGIPTGTPLVYWVSGGAGADATTIWTATGIPGGSGFTVKKAATDYRSVQGDFLTGIAQATTNADGQIDGIWYQGYNYNGGGRVNNTESAIGINLENHWVQAGYGNYGQVEYYLQQFSRDGGSSRPFAFYVSKQDGSGNEQHAIDAVTFTSSPATGNVQYASLIGGTGTLAITGTAPFIAVTNSNAGGGIFGASPQSTGAINFTNTSSTAFPGNNFYFNSTLVKMGGSSASAGVSPRDIFQVIGSATTANVANMSLSTQTSSSAVTAFIQGTGGGTAGNRFAAIGIDGNVSDVYYGFNGSSNNLLVRMYNGGSFQTMATFNTGSGNVELQSLGLQTLSTATAAGTTTLTNASKGIQIFTGATTQTVTMPVVTTLTNGFMFRIVNLSSGVVTVQTSGSNTVKAMAATSVLDIWVKDTTAGTGTASWNWFYNASLNN